MYTHASFENGNGGIAGAPIDYLRKTPPVGFLAGYVVRDTSNLPLIRELSDTLPIFGRELSLVAIAAPPSSSLFDGGFNYLRL